MEVNECINNRRSIRKFKTDKVEKEVILELIKSAQKAPSWKNSQVSRYYVVEDLKEEVMSALPEFNQNSSKDAPVLIVSTVVNGRSGFERDGSYTTHLKEGFQYFDNGLQIENLCLKAYEMGLGTLIMGIYDVDKIREILQIPEEQIIVSVIALGYPDINPEMPKRKDLTDIVIFK